METLFRFMLTRPAVAQSEDAPSIPLAQESPFQAALGDAQASRDRRGALKAAARAFVQSPGFVGDPKGLPPYEKMSALGSAFDALEKELDVSNEEAGNAVKAALGAKPATLVERGTLEAPRAALKDSLIAIKLLPEEHSRPIAALTRLLRDLEVVGKLAQDADFPGTGKALWRYRRRSVLLPTGTGLASVLSTGEREKEEQRRRREEEEKRKREAEEGLTRYRRLGSAIEDLARLGSEHLQSTPQRPHPGAMMPAALRPVELFTAEMTRYQQLAQLQLLRAQVTVGREAEGHSTPAPAVSARTVPRGEAGALVESVGSFPLKLKNGSGEFLPLSGQTGFRLKPTAESVLAEDTRTILKERRVSVIERPLDHVVEALRSEQLGLARQLDVLFGRPMQMSLKRVGHTLVRIASPMPSTWNSLVYGTDTSASPAPLPVPIPLEDRIPHSHGQVAPSGIADLLIVKQQLVRYEAADAAHIENVLRGEKKDREHLRRRETEELTVRESEVTTSEERELESTNRFELSRETNSTIREDAELKAGLTLSGKYGPTVEFSATAEGALSRSREEATKTAATFSQEVTERSANKVTERVLRRESLRVTNEVVEKNLHTLSNVGGAAHISGVYQWVNKVYEAQMYNYGLRVLFDFMVPEPGAFLVAALQKSHAHSMELEKPLPFTLWPDQITERNYPSWTLLYQATDVTAPPEVFVTKALDYSAGGGDSDTDYNHSAQIQIPDGYKAVHGSVGKVANIWEDYCSVDVVLGNKTNRFVKGEWMWDTPLDGELDAIPFALNTYKISDLAVAVEVKCQRTERALLKWAHETHAKLTQAYKARLAEYEEKLANLEMQVGVVIKGKNPALNLELMKDELRKNCITILTRQHFDLFGAVNVGPNALPQTDLLENDAEGPYVRFFEQACEWEHLTWVTYPYFWGRKSQWEDKVAYEDSDPQFNQFLKAGYCRVVVPLRRGFEGAMDHFMTFGELWNGGPLPPISSPLYLPIADEIAERLARPGEEVPEGDPWLVRIPTTLVHLRPDDRLPAWVKNAEGEWVPE